MLGSIEQDRIRALKTRVEHQFSSVQSRSHAHVLRMPKIQLAACLPASTVKTRREMFKILFCTPILHPSTAHTAAQIEHTAWSTTFLSCQRVRTILLWSASLTFLLRRGHCPGAQIPPSPTPSYWTASAVPPLRVFKQGDHTGGRQTQWCEKKDIVHGRFDDR